MINELSLLRGRGLMNVKFDVKLEGNLERETRRVTGRITRYSNWRVQSILPV